MDVGSLVEVIVGVGVEVWVIVGVGVGVGVADGDGVGGISQLHGWLNQIGCHP